MTQTLANVQVKGEQCQALQGQCDQLQHEVNCHQAELAKVRGVISLQGSITPTSAFALDVKRQSMVAGQAYALACLVACSFA